MSWLHAIRARLGLLARESAEARMNDEIDFHVQMETERLVGEEGLDPVEARRRALVAFGGVTKHAESLRDDRGLAWLGGMRLDFLLGIRMLVKYPVLTLVGVVGMSVAVAIGSMAFSAVNTVIDASLPLDEGERVVAIQDIDIKAGQDAGRRLQLHDLVVWHEALSAVEDIGAFRTVDRNLITPDRHAESVRIAEMSASGFRLTRVPPLLGRYFHDADERPGAAPVAVIGYDVWQTRFAGRSDIVGLSIQLGDVFHTVIGVMPKGYAFPINNRVWTPLRLNRAAFERGNAPPVDVFGRLAPNASLADAQRQIQTIGQRLAREYPRTHTNVRPRVLEYTRSVIDTPDLAWAFHLVQVVVSLLLVVIGTNVAILVYARTAHRASEIAVRTALGASRARVVSQLFAEALVLSSIAAGIGVFVAHLGLTQAQAVLVRTGGEQLPFWLHFGVTPSVVVYAASMAVLAAIIVGVVPALKATCQHVHSNLQLQGAGSGMRLGKTWTFLIVAQVTVAVALLPIALVGVRQLGRLSTARISTGEFLTATIALDAADDDKSLARRFATFRQEYVDRLLAEPAVSGVTLTSSTLGSESEVRIEPDAAGVFSSGSAAASQDSYLVAANRVDLGFFDSFHIPILVGRAFQPTDVAPTTTAVIVNRSFVERVLGGGNPIGRRIRVPPRRQDESDVALPQRWEVVIGVAADWASSSDSSVFKPRMYRPLPAEATEPVTITVRMRTTTPAAFSTRLRELAASVDPMLRVSRVAPLDEALRDATAADRAAVLILGAVALSVVLLSAAGIYALVSFTIVRRRREIGIRAALGAGPRRLLMSVLWKSLRQVVAGVAMGLAIALLLDILATGNLPIAAAARMIGLVGAIMTVVATIAVIDPAVRALKIQPTEALRSE